MHEDQSISQSLQNVGNNTAKNDAVAKIAIIGAGFTGSEVAIRVARQATDQKQKVKITIFEKEEKNTSKGVAYSEYAVSKKFRTNLPIGHMGPEVDRTNSRSGHLLNFLNELSDFDTKTLNDRFYEANKIAQLEKQKDEIYKKAKKAFDQYFGPNVKPPEKKWEEIDVDLDPIPRKLYGLYLKYRFLEAQIHNSEFAEFEFLTGNNGQVTSIDPEKFTITTNDEESHSYDNLVIATGNLKAKPVPQYAKSIENEGCFYHDQWDIKTQQRMQQNVKKDDDVLILGSALSAYDIAIILGTVNKDLQSNRNNAILP